MQKFVRAKISIAKESVSSDANFESFVDWSTIVFDFASHKSGNKWKLIQIFFLEVNGVINGKKSK